MSLFISRLSRGRIHHPRRARQGQLRSADGPLREGIGREPTHRLVAGREVLPLALSTVDGFLLPGLVSVEGVGQKNGCATTDQKRNNERHEQYSCSDNTFLTRFGFRTASLG
jgi:hypothetical protein